MENGDLDSFASDESVGIVVGSINVFQRSPGPFDLVEMAFGFGDVTVVDVDIHLLDWLFVLEVVVIGYLYGHVGTLAVDAALLTPAGTTEFHHVSAMVALATICIKTVMSHGGLSTLSSSWRCCKKLERLFYLSTDKLRRHRSDVDVALAPVRCLYPFDPDFVNRNEKIIRGSFGII